MGSIKSSYHSRASNCNVRAASCFRRQQSKYCIPTDQRVTATGEPAKASDLPHTYPSHPLPNRNNHELLWLASRGALLCNGEMVQCMPAHNSSPRRHAPPWEVRHRGDARCTGLQPRKRKEVYTCHAVIILITTPLPTDSEAPPQVARAATQRPPETTSPEGASARPDIRYIMCPPPPGTKDLSRQPT